MAELRIIQIKRQALATADLELEADADEGFEILEIGCDGGAVGSACTLSIGGVSMLGWPTAADKEEVAPTPQVTANTHSLLKTLQAKYPDVPTWKVAPGEKLVISSGGATVNGNIYYRQLSADQAPSKTDPGGSQGPRRLFISHGKAEWTVPAGQTKVQRVNINLNPTPLRGFPWVEDVPAEKVYKILGLCTRRGDGSGANITYDGIRMWHKDISILAPEEEFLSPSHFPYPISGSDRDYFLFPKFILCKANEEVKIEVKASNAGAADETAQIFVTLLILEEAV